MKNEAPSSKSNEERFALALNTSDIAELSNLLATNTMDINKLYDIGTVANPCKVYPIIFAAKKVDPEMIHLFLSIPDIKLDVTCNGLTPFIWYFQENISQHFNI